MYLRDYETFEDVAAHLPRFLNEVSNHRRLLSTLRYLKRRGARPGKTTKKAARRCCAGRGTGAFYQGNLLLRKGPISKLCNLKGRTVDG